MNLFEFDRTPRIGLVGWSTGENSFGATKPYLQFLSQIGDVRILTARADIDTDLDIVIMPGGKDTLPSNYGGVPSYYNNDPDQFKEHFFKVNLPQYIEHGTPIFGICLGFQQICVHFGGVLTQNVGSDHGHSDEGGKGGRGELVNDIIFTPEYLPLQARLLKNKKDKIKTCSLHHQGILIENMPDTLNVIGYTEDNVVEFFIHESLPIAGCQSHPEEDWCPLSLELMSRLIHKGIIKNDNDKTHATAEATIG